jgi:hypothetical protein
MQPNAGKTPFSIQQWREKNDGTHAVMATALVKKGGTKNDVKKRLEEAAKPIWSGWVADHLMTCM